MNNKIKESNGNIAKAIYEVRKENELSQEEFAEKIGVTRQAVSRWEMGVSVPSINTLILIGDKFDVSVDTLLKRKSVNREKKEVIKERVTPKEAIKYNIIFLVIGFLGLAILPFLAEWKRSREMALFKTAYEHSYDYISEYPLFIILILALLSISLGIYLIYKNRRDLNEKEND